MICDNHSWSALCSDLCGVVIVIAYSNMDKNTQELFDSV